MSRVSFNRFIIIFLLLSFTVLACNLSSPRATQVSAPPPTELPPTTVPEPTSTNTPAPTSTPVPTDTPLPTATPEPIVFLASAESMDLGDYRIRVTRIAYDDTLMGLKPSAMDSGEHLLCVEFDLLSGDRTAFLELAITAINDSGLHAAPVARMADRRTELLTSMTMTGEAASFEPDPERIAWAFVVPKSGGKLFLQLPTGERVDLSSPPKLAGTSMPSSSATPLPPSATPTSSTPLPTWTIAARSGEEKIRVENNSGQDFYIKMDCSGGPCQTFSNAHYEYRFPAGLYFFYVYPGRYKITWTICGKTETFEHVLNAQWYILLKKCK